LLNIYSYLGEVVATIPTGRHSRKVYNPRLSIIILRLKS